MNSFSREFLTKSYTDKEWYEIFSSPLFDEQYAYEGDDLGCNYSKNKTIFNVWAPTASKVSVALYSSGNYKTDKNPISIYKMTYKDKGLWQLILKEDLIEKYYTYIVNVNGIVNETTDPYGKSCGVNGKRNMILDLNVTNPKNWENDKHICYPLNQSIIYELHIGDFSNDSSSGINELYRGKYLAFTIKNSFLNNKEKNKPTCLDYLVQLGITTIHLLPTYDYGSVEEDFNELKNNDYVIKDANYNWGYDPCNYNIPEGSYSTNPYDGKIRIKEFKQMIQSLHNEKISVIMDVVYNHTYKTFLSNFEKIVPNYYYRQKDNGEKSNGSGCNNDTASERRMVHNFIVNSVLFWAKEYHIDGFRFDLMGLHDLDLMNDIRNQLNEKIEKGNEIIIYGEPWTMNTHISLKGFNKPMADKNNIDLFPNGISFFHDEFRDIVKGNTFNKTEKGFVSGSLIYANNNEYEKILEEFKYYFIGGINVNGKKEIVKNSKLINYLSCHDNNTLWDKLVIVENDLQEIKYKSEDNNVILTREIEKDNIKIIPKELKSFNDNDQNIFLKRDEIVIKKNKLAAAILMFSFGVPFFQAGEEGARTKLGEGNSYNLSKSLNQIDWERMYKFEDLINYYKKVIKIRKKLLNFYELNRAKYNNIDGLPKGIVGFHIQRIKYGKYKEIILIFNSTQNDYTYKINGNSKWKIILSEDIKNKYVENREFTIYKISAGIIGIKDPNYKNNK